MPKDAELAKRYGLGPMHESLQRLTRLVVRRDFSGDASAQDEMLTGRWLSAANPHARSETEHRFTTVKDKLARVGMNEVLIRAMVDPLLNAVHKTFSTMLSIDLKQTNVAAMASFKGDHVLGAVQFTGKTTGLIHLRLLPISARAIAMIMLDLKEDEVTGQAEIDNVIGELSNIIVGNLKSNLCDAKLDCKLETPHLALRHRQAERQPGGTLRFPRTGARSLCGYQCERQACLGRAFGHQPPKFARQR